MTAPCKKRIGNQGKENKRYIQNRQGGEEKLGRFFIFLIAVLMFALIGIAIWWIWSKVNIVIKRQESVFDIEKETHEKVKKRIKEEQ